ncbi:Y-family DNA polymerase [Sedimenticola sp.]|uniref:Y-family DNA polymerase n=1 Tax=Sedimenticola sp. TaxID=1940285 RepID=UPI003D0BCED5
MLWLALRFSHLALELAVSLQADSVPLVIRELGGSRQQVFDANTAARRLGVRQGMSMKQAQLLIADLTILDRDAVRESKGLTRLAHWAMQFTSRVVLQPPRGLLLEIGASRRLFGGVTTLHRQVIASCGQLGHRPRSAIAPNPQAAWWFSALPKTQVIIRDQDLREALETLPLGCLELSDRQRQALRRLGLRYLGQCLRLPRAGLRRRFGEEWLERLDCALGHRSDPRADFQPPFRFEVRLELPAEVDHCSGLLFGLRRLLQELGGVLLGSDAAIDRLTLTLEYADLPATDISLQLLRPLRDPGYLLELWRERLEREILPAPVLGLRLTSAEFQPADHTNLGLLGRASGCAEGAALWERLQARLGREVVRQLGVVADHRPELAWSQNGSAEGIPSGRRPLWLLEPPERLRQGPQGPWRDGPLRLEQGPERIESGWWQGRWVRRDYFIATDSHGARLWLFRQADDRHWYLHGRFG